MATIALYKDKLNGVDSLINIMVSSVNNLDTQLGTLKFTLQGVNSNTYNLDGAVDNIRSSSKTEKEKVEDLKKLNTEVDNFITVTVNRDNAAKEELIKAKEDFYTKYSYLKPECEKGFIEKVVDTVESAAEWCCEHWKLIVTIVIVVVAIAILWTGVGGVILAGACSGAISGALFGGVIGGIKGAINGEGFLKGFENGAFSGVISGAVCGAIFAGIGVIGTKISEGIKNRAVFEKAFQELEQSGLRPGQTVISKSRVFEIMEKYDPLKASSRVYTDATGRYLVEGHHTTVATIMLGKNSAINMNIPIDQLPSAMNICCVKKWYEFGKKVIKVID